MVDLVKAEMLVCGLIPEKEGKNPDTRTHMGCHVASQQCNSRADICAVVHWFKDYENDNDQQDVPPYTIWLVWEGAEGLRARRIYTFHDEDICEPPSITYVWVEGRDVLCEVVFTLSRWSLGEAWSEMERKRRLRVPLRRLDL